MISGDGARSQEWGLRGVMVTKFNSEALLTAHLEVGGDLGNWQAMGGCDGSPSQGLFRKGGGCGPINMTLVLIEAEGCRWMRCCRMLQLAAFRKWIRKYKGVPKQMCNAVFQSTGLHCHFT